MVVHCRIHDEKDVSEPQRPTPSGLSVEYSLCLDFSFTIPNKSLRAFNSHLMTRIAERHTIQARCR